MSFWKTSDNQVASENTTGSYDTSNGPAIPDNTNAKACVEDAKWDEYEGLMHINIRWTILDGDYKNGKVFQKLKVNDPDSKKSDKALRMLAAIDHNAGKQLSKIEHMPSDLDLVAALQYKPMVIKIMRWEMGGREGNWISKVAPITGDMPVVEIPDRAAPTAYDEDIPF